MKKNQIYCFVGILLSFVFLMGNASFAASPTVLKFVSFLPNQYPSNANFVMFTEKVKQKTGGALIVRIIGGPEAMAPPDAPRAVQSGSIPIANVLNSLTDQIVPGYRVLTHNELPYKEMREKALPFIQEICNKAGIYYLGQAKTAHPQTMLMNFSTKNVTKLADLKGMKLGSPSPFAVPFYKALGAVPVIIPFTEYYTAIERGVIQGMNYSPEDLVRAGLHRVIKTAINHGYASSPDSFIINLKTWQGLSKDFQNALTAAAEETENEFGEMYDKKIREPAREEMRKAGVKFIKFSPAEAAKYYELYKTASWASEMKRNPQNVQKLRDLITKN